MALGDWVAGWLIGSLNHPPRFMGASGNPAGFAFVRFMAAVALMEAGAIMGLMLTFMTHDARYAVAFATPAFLLMLLAGPAGARDTGQAS